jgi:L-asparaginase
MAYTASALSFCLANLDKPVVLTGSQVPLMSIRSDARRNLINAIEVATMPINEVAVCFNDCVFRGNRTTKMSIGDFDAFASPNFPPLAEIGLKIRTRFQLEAHNGLFQVTADFDNHVYVLKLIPGLDPRFLYPLLNDPPRVLIIEAFGCGNIPISGPYNLLPFIKQCRDKEIPVVVRSQADYDSVDLTKYRSGKELLALGAIGAGDMTTESTVTKMMYLLAHDDAKADIAERFITPIAGEITQK